MRQSVEGDQCDNIIKEAVLESFEYLYTFMLFISTEKGETGDFKLQMFCSDKEAVLIEDKDFDREEF